MLLETASWKHKLQSHVPLLYSSGTCNLSAKISKLATPNSPKGAQAGIGTRALLGSPATCPHISSSGWHLPMDQNELMALGIFHHQQSNKFRLCNRYKVKYKVRNVHVTQRKRVAGVGPDWICFYIPCGTEKPHSCNFLGAGYTHRLKIKVPLSPYLSLKTTPSASGGAIDSWKGVLK